MATTLPWYKEVNPTQKKALFAAWLGYVFDGFDYMLITYVLLDIQREFSMTTTETSTLLLAAFVARPLGGALFGSFADKYGRRLAMMVSIIVYSVGYLPATFGSLFFE